MNLEKSKFAFCVLSVRIVAFKLFEFERVAVELIVAGKKGRTAAEASVTVFFYG